MWMGSKTNNTSDGGNTHHAAPNNFPWPPATTPPAETAEELMTPAPVHVHSEASVKQAAILMADHHLSALPVLDDNGQVVGVINQSDIIRHKRDKDQEEEGTCIISLQRSNELDSLSDGIEQPRSGGYRVRKLMTPIVYSVAPDTSPAMVVDQMRVHEIHRVFVIDERKCLLGVITAFDIIRNLRG